MSGWKAIPDRVLQTIVRTTTQNNHLKKCPEGFCNVIYLFPQEMA
jgi:hypothetical protein